MVGVIGFWRSLMGELGLDGSIRPVRGVLPAVLSAARLGMAQIVVPGTGSTFADRMATSD